MGALRKATREDVRRAVEPDGRAVDPIRVEAARMFNVAYERVTPLMRKEGKRRMHAGMYSGLNAFWGRRG